MSRIEYTPNPPPQTLTEQSSKDLALYLQNELTQISSFIGEITEESSDGGSASNPNLLINGNFTVNQRGFAGGQPAAGVYGYDRWKGDTLGTRIEQVIENTETLSGSYTISWVGGTGTADVDGTTGLNSGDSVTMTATGNYSVIVPTDATEIKFEEGSTATPYQARLYDEEWALCRRYYRSEAIQISSGWDSTFLQLRAGIAFDAMRAAPAMTLVNWISVNHSNWNGNGGIIVGSNTGGFAYVTAADTAYRTFSVIAQVTYTADAEL